MKLCLSTVGETVALRGLTSFFPSLETVVDVAIDIVANAISQPKAPNVGTRYYETSCVP